jgi:general secretion pathway protein G
MIRRAVAGPFCRTSPLTIPKGLHDMSVTRVFRLTRTRLPRGFTLIEIMVVVVILGILAALVAPNVIRRIDDAQIAKAKQDIRSYETALNLFRMDNFKYPTTDQGLAALVTKPSDTSVRNWREGGYISGMRKDPWGNDYHYQNPGSHGEYDLFTLGADGAEGGEGINADVGNWNIE